MSKRLALVVAGTNAIAAVWFLAMAWVLTLWGLSWRDALLGAACVSTISQNAAGGLRAYFRDINRNRSIDDTLTRLDEAAAASKAVSQALGDMIVPDRFDA